MPNITGLTLNTTQGVLYPPISATVSLTLSGYGFASNAGGTFSKGLDRSYTFSASAIVGGVPYGAVLSHSGNYPFQAFAGGGASLTLSLPTLTASGTGELLGSVTATLSGYTLVASATADKVGRAQVSLSGYSLRSYAGGIFRATLTGYTLSARGTTDRYGSVSLTLPRARLTASATQDNVASVVGVLPTLKSAYGAVVVARLPVPTLYALGTTGTAAAYEAYSFTFLEARDSSIDVAATRYTNYPFDRIVRFNDKYYGLAQDGAFELNGETFDGAPIISVFETASTDFDDALLKRPISLYIAGEVQADFRVTVNTAEVRDDTYTYRTVDKTGARNYRVMFGKGLRARYLSYAFTNTNGGNFVLDDLTPEVAVLRRTA